MGKINGNEQIAVKEWREISKYKLMYSDGKSVFLRRKGAGRRVGTMKGYKEILGSNEF